MAPFPITKTYSSCPAAEECHDTGTQAHLENADGHFPHWCLVHLLVENKVVGKELHKTRIDKNTRRDSIKDARDIVASGRIGRVRVAHTQADSHTNWRAN